MREYTIITDIGCDIPAQTLQQWQVKCVDFTFHFEGDPREYRNSDISSAEFYQYLRDGKNAKTSAANMDFFREMFEPELRAGRDVLYLGFSSGLSNSAHFADLTAKELMEEYPGSHISALDTRCASSGLGLLVYLTVQQKNAGAELTQAAAFAMAASDRLCHWFTVDDLGFLRRGGRIGTASALAGALLRIKPVLHMDDAGRIVNMRKVRGRRQAIGSILDQYLQTAQDIKGIYFISHSDCLQDAQLLDELLYAKTGNHATLMTDIGPVIGAHCGPGTLALYYLGTGR